ncbi:MAG: energy transducer TonB [Bacteroidota bacterium]
MNILNQPNNNLDELVFENRNKAYGAYVLRKEYPSNLKRSFLITFITPVAIILFSLIYNQLHGDVVPISPFDKDNQGDTVIVIEVVMPAKKQKEQIEEMYKPKAIKNADNGNYQVRRNTEVRTILSDSFVRSTLLDEPIGNPTGPTSAITTGGRSLAGNNEGNEDGNFMEGGVEQMPEFNGDLYEYLGEEINYPPVALQNNVQGKVLVSFVVDKDGKVKDATVLKGIGFGCDEEAIRVIKSMPDWSAGMQNKRKVSVRMIIPIMFQVTD